MSVTYYVALPFVKTEDGSAAGQAMECQSAPEANRKAEIMSRDPANVGALVHALGRSKLRELCRRCCDKEIWRRAG